MKKITFLLLTLSFAIIASVNVQKATATSASGELCNVTIDLQTGLDMNMGSTVTYHNGTTYTTEGLRIISNPLVVKKGTSVQVNLLVVSTSGGSLQVGFTKESAIYDYCTGGDCMDFYDESAVATGGRSYYINQDGAYIIARVEDR